MAQTFAAARDISPHSTIHLSDRQLRYMAARADGKTKEESVKLAGYKGDASPTQIEKSSNLRRALQIAMEQAGLTSEKLAEKIRAGVDAKKTNYYSFQGRVVDEKVSEDHEIQHKYVRTALEVRGDLSEGNEVNVNIGLVEIPHKEKSAEVWSESDESNAL